MKAAAVQQDSLRRLIEEALPVARERAQLLGDIQTALEKDDDRTALALMRRLCNLPPVRLS